MVFRCIKKTGYISLFKGYFNGWMMIIHWNWECTIFKRKLRSFFGCSWGTTPFYDTGILNFKCWCVLIWPARPGGISNGNRGITKLGVKLWGRHGKTKFRTIKIGLQVNLRNVSRIAFALVNIEAESWHSSCCRKCILMHTTSDMLRPTFLVAFFVSQP